MIIQLSRKYVCRYGAPVLDRVDTRIFQLKYFAHCMACNFCNDWCCSFGADVDVQAAKRILARSAELEQFTGVPSKDWFDPTDETEDDDAPGGLYLRLNAKNDACVFLNPRGRGCMLHSYSLQAGLDYHELKPMICAIFPLSFDDGLLVHADEVEDRELVCSGDGPSLYSGVRGELLYYFGQALIDELDAIATTDEHR